MWVAIYQIQVFRDVIRRHITDDLTLSQQHCCERVKSHRVHLSANPSRQCGTSSTNELTYFGGHNGNSDAQCHGPYIINIGININSHSAD